MPTIVERLSGSLTGDWSDTLTEFRVGDIPVEADSAQSILVCESPHVYEVTNEPMECRYPLRGPAGKTVTKALVQCQEPMALEYGGEGRNTVPVGRLVKQDQLDSFRIVNVCELPLQSETYARRLDQAIIGSFTEELTFKEWSRLILAFRTVRELRKATTLADDPLVAHILDDFHCRLGEVEQVRNLRVVVCGLCAQACWCRIGLPVPSDSNAIKFVAHPSRHSAWFEGSHLKERAREAVEALIGGTEPANN